LYWWGKEAKGQGVRVTGGIIKQEAEEVPTLRSLISVLDGIEEAANNAQLIVICST